MKIKYLALVVFSILVITSCKQSKDSNNKVEETVNYSEENLDVTTTVYPDNISKIFKTHGSIEKWNTLESFIFEIEKPEGNEKTTTALKSRKSLIEANTFTIGYNGKDVWLEEKDSVKYEGNPKFYYNLMFYFQAMPFVLADSGIIYEDVDPLKADGKEYPGIKISYEAEIGESPDDEYILYYDKETHKMTWLGYTVTYFSKEKSKTFRFIKYTNWQNINGLVLPTKLEWRNAEGFTIGTKRNKVKFVNIETSTTIPDDSLFEKL